MLDLNQIHQGDCLELMHQIPSQSIDMILCDLPYGTTVCSWDVVIPFQPLWAHYKRVIKPKGAIVLFGSQPFTAVLTVSNLTDFRHSLVWYKSHATGHLSCKRKPMKTHEDILVFGPGGLGTYNPQFTKKPPDVARTKQGRVQKREQTEHFGDYGINTVRSISHKLTYPKSVIYVPSPAKGTESGLHPVQKPVALFSYLIRTYTDPGELVLDNCIGSGTTAIAAIETGRNFIGIEKDDRYCRIARERIKERLKQPFLPLVIEENEHIEQKELFNP